MQIYRFSLIFHSISELNKEKQPDFTNFFAKHSRITLNFCTFCDADWRLCVKTEKTMIPHRDNNIKIVVFHIFALRFPL